MRSLILGLCLVFCFAATDVAPQIAAQIGGPVIQNASFESGLANWAVAAGNASVISTPDNMFPTDGSNFLLLETGDTGNATAGYGPHLAGDPGVAQIYQDFLMPSGQRTLTVAWEFINVEGATIGTYNDFVSIDLLDGSGALVTNIVFCDTGVLAGTPPYTNVPGGGSGQIGWVPHQETTWGSPAFSLNAAPAGPKMAAVDLESITTTGQVYRIAISLGNVGDIHADPGLLIDEVCLNVAQVNSAQAALRVLGSSHMDGWWVTGDQGGDMRWETPFRFFTTPGQRISFRASSSIEGTPWALVSGNLASVGPNFPGLGVVNIDVFAPFRFEINGFAPASAFEAMIGTITFNTNFLEGQIHRTASPGQRAAYQAIMADPVSSTGVALSAATEVIIGSPRIPVATTLIAGGANNDDGYSTVALSTMGNFTFFGTAYTEVHVGSNGYLTFGSGSTSLAESESSMINDARARIAGIWDDLNPSNTSIYGNGDLYDDQTTTTYTASWADVAEYSNLASCNNFTIQIYENGAATVYYGCTSLNDGLVGISPGYSISSSWNYDLSGSPGFEGGSHNIGPTGAMFQRFEYNILSGTTSPTVMAEKFDAMTFGNNGRIAITYYPDGTGGYRVYTGTR